MLPLLYKFVYILGVGKTAQWETHFLVPEDQRVVELYPPAETVTPEPKTATSNQKKPTAAMSEKGCVS